jgi:hypothetical protein
LVIDMGLDFWNNPLVVTAMRIRYRRGGLTGMLTLYFLLLATGSAALFYYRDKMPRSPYPRNVFLAMLAIQYLISFIFSSGATSASLRHEVTSRTLDFQRIATLSPLQIFVGKLMGEPMLAFFSLVPTIPFTVLTCFMLGVDGMDFVSVILVYVTLFTSSLVSGAMGLFQTLDSDPAGKPRQASNFGAVFFACTFCSFPFLFVGGSSILNTPWQAALFGLITPIPAYYGIVEGNPWLHGLHFFGLRIPFLIVTPISYLAITGVILHVMTRRLVNPVRIGMSRAVAYVLMICFDLLVAGVFFDSLILGSELYTRSAAFWLAHMVFGLALLMLITPSRECLWTWSWLVRGRLNSARDLAFGDRSLNTLALVILALVGLIDYFLMLILPAQLLFPLEQLNQFLPEAVRMATICTLVFLAGGSLFQLVAIVFDRSGRSLYFILLVLLIVPLDLTGRYYHVDILLGATPSGQFGWWLAGESSRLAWPVLVLYAALLLFTQYWIYRGLAAMNRTVERKLRGMKIEPPRVAGVPTS